MPFPADIREDALVRSGRHCCVCHQAAGRDVNVHHIVQEADGGPNTLENAIVLCSKCHGEAGHYNPRHPLGTKYSPSELRRHATSGGRIARAGTLPSTSRPTSVSRSAPVAGCQFIAARLVSSGLTGRTSRSRRRPWSSTQGSLPRTASRISRACGGWSCSPGAMGPSSSTSSPTIDATGETRSSTGHRRTTTVFSSTISTSAIHRSPPRRGFSGCAGSEIWRARQPARSLRPTRRGGRRAGDGAPLPDRPRRARRAEPARAAAPAPRPRRRAARGGPAGAALPLAALTAWARSVALERPRGRLAGRSARRKSANLRRKLNP